MLVRSSVGRRGAQKGRSCVEGLQSATMSNTTVRAGMSSTFVCVTYTPMCTPTHQQHNGPQVTEVGPRSRRRSRRVVLCLSTGSHDVLRSHPRRALSYSRCQHQGSATTGFRVLQIPGSGLSTAKRNSRPLWRWHRSLTTSRTRISTMWEACDSRTLATTTRARQARA